MPSHNYVSLIVLCASWKVVLKSHGQTHRITVRIISTAKRERCVIFNVDIPLSIGFRAARAVVFIRSARCDETIRETQNAARVNPWRVARGDSDDEFLLTHLLRLRCAEALALSLSVL